DLAGSWIGCGNAVGKDNGYRAENLSLSITEDGTFILSDIEQGTSLYDGSFTLDTKEKTISVTNKDDSYNTLPTGWDSFVSGDSVSYLAPDSSHLILTYSDVSYFFEKQDDSSSNKAESSGSALIDIADTDIWYSGDEISDDTDASGNTSADDGLVDTITNNESDNVVTYELALYDKYAEIYAIDSETSTSTFLTNFLYYSNEGDTFSFYTYRDEAIELPEIFTGISQGLSQVDLKLTMEEENCLQMNYNGNALSFYNNAIYGLHTSSTAYYLNNTCFTWRFDKTDHFCYFSADVETGRLSLYISDGGEGDADGNTICCNITIDEATSEIILDFDKAASKKTADKKSDLFQTFKKLAKENKNGLRISFILKDDSTLRLKAKKYFGKNYTFALSDY
ncbi:MAG: hypothetical protein LUF92_07345, partial [Clostridiales bacterium]|nr:hypothetical protein [Clostridiales bacterium]